MKKRTIFLTFALCLVIGAFASLTASATDTDYTDVTPGDWYYDAISAWSGGEAEILRGYGDGRFGPNDAMRAVDLDIVLARLLGGDVPAWRAGAPVTRETAAKALAQTLGLEPVDEPAALYADDAAIGAEFRAYVYALRASGAQQGVPGNEYNPKGTFTRAELVQSAYNAISFIADADVTGKTYEKTLIVRKPNLTIKNGAVLGDIIVGHGVGDGDLTLDNTSVSGRLVVYGGGSQSIVIKNGSKVAALVTGKANVHIQLESGVTIQSIEIVENGVRITVQKGASVETLMIDADGAEVEGDGTLSSVTVKPEAVGAIVKTPGTIIVNNSESYVTTANGVVRAGETQTTPATPGIVTGGGGGGSDTGAPPSTNPGEPQTVEVDNPDRLVQIIKAGTENVRIVVTRDMTVTTGAVGLYEPFDAYDLNMSGANSILYIPESVTLTIGSGVLLRVSGGDELVIDGTFVLDFDTNSASMYVGGTLSVGETGVLTTQTAIPGRSLPVLQFSKWATVKGNSACIAEIVGWFAQETKNPKPYGYHLLFELNDDGVWEWDGERGALAVYDLAQLLAAIADINAGEANPNGLRITNSFEITEDIDVPIWIIEDVATITIHSTFIVNGTLEVAGEMAGVDGGKVIIPAGAQIKNVLWGGGWSSDENGTGVLHGLPVDKDSNNDRIYDWQNGGWVLRQ